MNTRTNQPEALPLLTPMRGVAAVMVVASHLFILLPHLTNGNNWASNLIAHGWLWVDFFFMLSGFVLTHVYRDMAVTRTNYFSFIGKRFARIYPLHVFTLSWFVGLELIKLMFFSYKVEPFGTTGRDLASLVSNLLLVQSMNVHYYYSWNGPSWSISTEWHAYLLFPFLAWIIFKLHRSLLVLWIVACAGVLSWLSLRYETLDAVTFNLGFIRCLTEFSSGIVLYRLYMWLHARKWIAGDSLLTVLFLVILALLSITRPPISENAVEIATVLVIGLFIPTLATARSGVWHRVLSSKVFQWLGTISYSIYMVHWIAVDIAITDSKQLLGRKIIFWELDIVTSWLVMLVGLVAICSVATLTYLFVERPCRNGIRRILKNMMPS